VQVVFFNFRLLVPIVRRLIVRVKDPDMPIFSVEGRPRLVTKKSTPAPLNTTRTHLREQHTFRQSD
jgi:hypothetical protein